MRSRITQNREIQLRGVAWQLGLFSNNVVSFSRNVVLRGLLFSLYSVSKPRMLLVRADYVFSSLQLGELCYHCFRHDSVGLTSNTGGGVLPGSAPLDYLPGDQARDSEREFAYPPD